MEIQAELRRYITEFLLTPNGDKSIRDDEPLIESGRMDSMGLIQLLGFIEQQFGIDLMSVAGPDDFQSISSISNALSRQLVSR
jgi:acyl carrier protein